MASNPSTKKTRGSSFVTAEDVAVAKAWVSVSENPVVGAEQKGDAFFQAVAAVYNTKYKPPDRPVRTFESLRKRSKSINKECLRFAACTQTIQRQKPTGETVAGMVKLATALYNKKEVTSPNDDCGKEFKFYEVWQILRYHSKFLSDLDGLPAGSMEEGAGDGSPGKGDNSDEEGGNDPYAWPDGGRPLGRRKAKAELHKTAMAAKKLKLQEEAVQEQRKRNEALQQQVQIQLFTNAPEACNAQDTLDFFNIMRRRVLANLRRDNSADREVTGTSNPNVVPRGLALSAAEVLNDPVNCSTAANDTPI